MFLSKRLSTCALCNENWVWILLLILNSMRRMRVLLWNKIYLGAFEFAGVPGLICSLWSSHLFFPFDKAKHVGEKQTALNVHFYWNCVPFPDKTWMFSRPWKKGRKPASWKSYRFRVWKIADGGMWMDCGTAERQLASRGNGGQTAGKCSEKSAFRGLSGVHCLRANHGHWKVYNW